MYREKKEQVLMSLGLKGIGDKMKSPWLLIDVSPIAYRSMYVMSELSHEGMATGAIFGIFRLVTELTELFNTDRVVWCFDGGYTARLKIYPEYKANRHTNEVFQSEEMQARRSIREQLDRLRDGVLSEMGFRNVFCQKGYEADDVIASICQRLPEGETAIIVSGDNDFYQLLEGTTVQMWNINKKRSYSATSFVREFHIDPGLWSQVKAIAGCPGDNVAGIPGVGVKTAVKYLRGKLNHSTKAYENIRRSLALVKSNLKVVKLPLSGTEIFQLRDCAIDRQKWDEGMEGLGIETLRHRRRVKGSRLV